MSNYSNRFIAPELDSSPMEGRFAWLTPRRLLLFVIVWLSLFAAISIFYSNPFQSEPSALATPDYARVMFLHGLLIGMVGLMSLLVCQIMCIRSRHTQIWLVMGVLAATILSGVGGLFDNKIPGAEVPMWTQIFSFFALDEILIVLIVGMIWEFRTSSATRTLPYFGAFFAAIAMLGSAVMGHLAGWIMEFGWNTPSAIKGYALFAGQSSQDGFTGALIGSHSHEMVVGVIAMTIILVAQHFGYAQLKNTASILARIGVGMVVIGTILMTAIYLYAGFSSWAPPPWFVNGANGIASDDVITGILVMGGGLVVFSALIIGRLVRTPLRFSMLTSWVLSFATVVIAGYAIEMHSDFFGAGDPTAAGAANDGIFTWLHQDIGLFMLPALVLVMLAVEKMMKKTSPEYIGVITMIGTLVTFIGSMIYVFVDPVVFGRAFYVTSVGLAIVGLALFETIRWGLKEELTQDPVTALPNKVLHSLYKEMPNTYAHEEAKTEPHSMAH